jgi:hypothetical protein
MGDYDEYKQLRKAVDNTEEATTYVKEKMLDVLYLQRKYDRQLCVNECISVRDTHQERNKLREHHWSRRRGSLTSSLIGAFPHPSQPPPKVVQAFVL